MTSSGPAFELLKTWLENGDMLKVKFTGRSASVNLKSAVLGEVRESNIVARNDSGEFRWSFSGAVFTVPQSGMVLVRTPDEECTFSK